MLSEHTSLKSETCIICHSNAVKGHVLLLIMLSPTCVGRKTSPLLHGYYFLRESGTNSIRVARVVVVNVAIIVDIHEVRRVGDIR